MPIDQNDITKIFVESVKNLIESGEVKTQQEIADKIDLHRNALHLILKGERNIPPPKFKKFREIYITQQNAPVQEVIGDAPSDYKEKYIALLEKTLAEQEVNKKALERELAEHRKEFQEFKNKINTNLKTFQDFAVARMAYLRATNRNLAKLRAKVEKRDLEDVLKEHRRVIDEETDAVLDAGSSRLVS